MQIARTAQRRMCSRYYQLLKRGKTPGQATTAVARELLGFVWAIAQVVAGPADAEHPELVSDDRLASAA